MTLDVLSFLADKGGDPAAIKESQRKRGLSEEIVDEVVALYNEWIKCASAFCSWCFAHRACLITRLTVGFEVQAIQKQSNGLQKEIGLKKKVREGCDGFTLRGGPDQVACTNNLAG